VYGAAADAAGLESDLLDSTGEEMRQHAVACGEVVVERDGLSSLSLDCTDPQPKQVFVVAAVVSAWFPSVASSGPAEQQQP